MNCLEKKYYESNQFNEIIRIYLCIKNRCQQQGLAFPPMNGPTINF